MIEHFEWILAIAMAAILGTAICYVLFFRKPAAEEELSGRIYRHLLGKLDRR